MPWRDPLGTFQASSLPRLLKGLQNLKLKMAFFFFRSPPQPAPARFFIFQSLRGRRFILPTHLYIFLTAEKSRHLRPSCDKSEPARIISEWNSLGSYMNNAEINLQNGKQGFALLFNSLRCLLCDWCFEIYPGHLFLLLETLAVFNLSLYYRLLMNFMALWFHDTIQYICDLFSVHSGFSCFINASYFSSVF